MQMPTQGMRTPQMQPQMPTQGMRTPQIQRPIQKPSQENIGKKLSYKEMQATMDKQRKFYEEQARKIQEQQKAQRTPQATKK